MKIEISLYDLNTNSQSLYDLNTISQNILVIWSKENKRYNLSVIVLVMLLYFKLSIYISLSKIRFLKYQSNTSTSILIKKKKHVHGRERGVESWWSKITLINKYIRKFNLHKLRMGWGGSVGKFQLRPTCLTRFGFI